MTEQAALVQVALLDPARPWCAPVTLVTIETPPCWWCRFRSGWCRRALVPLPLPLLDPAALVAALVRVLRLVARLDCAPW